MNYSLIKINECNIQPQFEKRIKMYSTRLYRLIDFILHNYIVTNMKNSINFLVVH